MAAKRKIGIFVPLNMATTRGVLGGIVRFADIYGPWQFYLQDVGDVQAEWLHRGLKVDGVIGHLPRRREFEIDLLRKTEIPVVNISDAAPDELFPKVVPDHVAVGSLAARYFLDRGFWNFGYCGYAGTNHSDARQLGFEQTLREAGHTSDIYEDAPDSDHAVYAYNPWEHHEIEAWISTLRKPLAVFACTDIRARHVLIACLRLGLSVPEEVAILGVDNNEVLCDTLSPPLSSIPLDDVRTGYAAAQLLDRLMKGEPRPDGPIRTPPLAAVTRRSSDVLAIEDPDVATAIRFIRENAHKPITIDNVLNVVAVSRRTLQLRFHGVLRRTIQQEIWRVHIDRAQKLLVDSTLSMGEIARALGFRTAQALSEMFHRQTGLSPRDFRARQQHPGRMDVLPTRTAQRPRAKRRR